MKLTRRDLSFLLPLLAARSGSGQDPTLPSGTYLYEDLPVKVNGPNSSRAILKGLNHEKMPFEMHVLSLVRAWSPTHPTGMSMRRSSS